MNARTVRLAALVLCAVTWRVDTSAAARLGARATRALPVSTTTNAHVLHAAATLFARICLARIAVSAHQVFKEIPTCSVPVRTVTNAPVGLTELTSCPYD